MSTVIVASIFPAGSQWDRLSSGPGLKPYDSSAQLGWKGHPDHPSVKSESNHKLEAACSTERGSFLGEGGLNY
eukprot:scaffold294575_cov16-Tisochrysis_lutea.AAC.1